MSGHPIVHVELSANDREAAGEFYSALFGWQIQHIPEMHYTTFTAADGPTGGFAQVGDGMAQVGQTTVYVGTDDIDASLAKAESLGGKTILPKMEVPNTGWIAVFEDLTGNQVGLFTLNP